MRSSHASNNTSTTSRQHGRGGAMTPPRDAGYRSEARARPDNAAVSDSSDDLKRRLGIEIGAKREGRQMVSRMPVIKETVAHAEASDRKDDACERQMHTPDRSPPLLNEFNARGKLASQTSNEFFNDEPKVGATSLMKARSDNQRANRTPNRLFESERTKPAQSDTSFSDKRGDEDALSDKLNDTKKSINSMHSVKNFTKKQTSEAESGRRFENIKTSEREPKASEQPSTTTEKPKAGNAKDVDLSLKNDVEIAGMLEEKIQGVLRMMEQVEKLKKIDLKPQKELFNKQLKVIIKKLSG